MGLTIDLAAVQNNTRITAELCRAAGFRPQAVIKPAYAIPVLLKAIEDGGIDDFAAATPAVARTIRKSTRGSCTLLSLPPPDFDASRHAYATASLHVRPDTADRAITLCPGHNVWIEVMTSDGREGLQPEAALHALEFLRSCAPSRSRFGLLFNWGCLQTSPNPLEVEEAILLRRIASERTDMPTMLSLGGSALLPILDSISSNGDDILRVGEAIVSGTIPGNTNVDLGLKPPIYLKAMVTDGRQSLSCHGKSSKQVLIDRGYTCLDSEQFQLRGVKSKVLDIYSDCCLLEIQDESAEMRWGQSVELVLGYRSIIRSLLNRQVTYKFVSDFDSLWRSGEQSGDHECMSISFP